MSSEPKVEIVRQSGVKHDTGKPALELLPPSYWICVDSKYSVEMSEWYFYEQNFPKHNGFDPVSILEFGREKYAAHNWFQGMRWGRLVGAYHRHNNFLDKTTGLWLPREDLNEPDEESGQPHGKHASCCWLFLKEYYNAWVTKALTIGENDCAWNYRK
jgi:hypothetical protein